jgi:soluble lytic murein transglycosylase-like protein
VLVAVAMLVPLSARAQSVHHFVDRDGVMHLTNLHGRHAKAATAIPKSTYVPMVLLEAVIAESASLYKIPQALVKAVIATESNYNPWAVSERGAIGLMQLMPQTAKEMYVDDPFDPVQNIYGGTRYLRVLVNEFDGDLVKVVAAYNAGPEAVKRSPSRPVPDIPETQEYVRRVLMNYQTFRTGETASTGSPQTTSQADGSRGVSGAAG